MSKIIYLDNDVHFAMKMWCSRNRNQTMGKLAGKCVEIGLERMKEKGVIPKDLIW